MLDKDLALDFILVCKEESHKTLYQYVAFLNDDIQTVEVKRWKGKRLFTDTYYFLIYAPWIETENTNRPGRERYKLKR